jgi:hypothetical protein
MTRRVVEDVTPSVTHAVDFDPDPENRSAPIPEPS